MKRIKVRYIKWERSDAVGKATSAYQKLLKNRVDISNTSLPIIESKYKLLSYIQLLKNLSNLSKALLSNEVVHFEEPKTIESNLILIFRNKKSILTVNHLENKKSLHDLSFFLSRWKHNSFSKLIAISEKTKQDLIKQYDIDPNRIEVIHHGVDKKIFRPTNQKLKFLKNKKYILYLGSEIPRKNIENLLKAFKEIAKKYPNLILVKAGYHGGEQHRKNTLKLIEKYKLKDKVMIISDYLEEKDLPLYYSNAELFIYPSLQEGFGMPLVESMACGCPVVTSNIAPMNEIANNQVLVNPYKYKEIAEGIDGVLSNKKYRKELSEDAIKRAKDFDWEKSAKKIIELYKQITS